MSDIFITSVAVSSTEMPLDDHRRDSLLASDAPLTIELCRDSGTIRIRRSTIRGTHTETVDR
jgi:hypothetical protein